MKKIITLALLFCACIFATHAQTILMSEGFEDGFPETWNNIDHDGDGFLWEVLTADEDLIDTHTGNGCIASASYNYEEDEALEPDNYLITPAITIPDNLTAANMPLLSWWVAAQDPEYPADYYEVRISTTGNSASDFSASAVYAEILSTNEWTMHTVDLRNYIGQTIYIAFIHTNCSDEFIMKLDDIAVLYFDTPSIVVTPDVLDFGSVMINTTSASMPVNVISALLDGTHDRQPLPRTPRERDDHQGIGSPSRQAQRRRQGLGHQRAHPLPQDQRIRHQPMKMKAKIAVLVMALALVCQGCGIYSFSGASIPAEAKTVSVDYFPNHAQLVNPLLSNNFTNALRDAMTNQTTLDMVETGGDLAFEGEITDYKTMPVAITSGQTAAMNRLTITVKVRFSNRIDDTKDFEQSFSRYEDYPSDQDLNSVQESLTATIVEQLVEDIFNKALVNW